MVHKFVDHNFVYFLYFSRRSRGNLTKFVNSRQVDELLHLQPPRAYTCRLLGVARADSRGDKFKRL